MRNKLMILISMFGLISVVSCTQNSSHALKGKEKSERSIASYKKKARKRRASRKPVKIVTKGFYIKHSSMRRLPYKLKEAYYSSFTKAAMDFERSFGKSNRSSASFNLQDFFDLITPPAHAAVCGNALWVLNRPGISCTGTNSYFNPVEYMGDYGPPAAFVRESTNRCSGSQIPCPIAGVQLSGGKAYLRCTSNSKGVSGRCNSFFSNGGYRNTIKLLDECDRLSPSQTPGSASNITCGDLDKSIKSYARMWEDNCKNKGSQNDVLDYVCPLIRAAKNTVLNRAAEENDPSRITSLPDTPSCNKAQEELGHYRENGETTVDPSNKNMDDQWKQLLRVAGQCPRGSSKGKNYQVLANEIFGRCNINSSISSPTGYTRQELIDLYSKNRNLGKEDYVRQFAEQFGMIPSRYEKLFCDSTSTQNFGRKVVSELDDHIYASQTQLTRIARFSPSEVPGILANIEAPSGTQPGQLQSEKLKRQEKAFESLKQFYNSNRQSLLGISSSGQTARNSEDQVSDGQKDVIRRKVLGPILEDWNGENSDYFRRRFDAYVNKATGDQKRKIRAAMNAVLKESLLGPSHASRLEKAQKWLQNCLDINNPYGAVTMNDEKAEKFEGVSYEPDSDGCAYRLQSNVENYAVNYDGRPLIVYQKGPNNTPGTCYVQRGGINEKRTGSNSFYKWISVENPVNRADRKDEVQLDSDLFENRSAGKQPFQLYASFCSDVDSETELEDPGSIW